MPCRPFITKCFCSACLSPLRARVCVPPSTDHFHSGSFFPFLFHHARWNTPKIVCSLDSIFVECAPALTCRRSPPLSSRPFRRANFNDNSKMIIKRRNCRSIRENLFAWQAQRSLFPFRSNRLFPRYKWCRSYSSEKKNSFARLTHCPRRIQSVRSTGKHSLFSLRPRLLAVSLHFAIFYFTCVISKLFVQL